jgi:exodeoxyribonuclease VII large subunit
VLTHARQRLARCESNEWFRRPLDVLRQSSQQVDEVQGRLRLVWSHRVQALQRRLHDAEVRLTRNRPDAVIARMLQALSDRQHRLFVAVSHRVQRAERQLVTDEARFNAAAPTHRLRLLREHVNGLEARLHAGSHESVLRRGFAIARDANGNIITRAVQAAPGDRLDVQLSAGRLESIVSKVIERQDTSSDA